MSDSLLQVADRVLYQLGTVKILAERGVIRPMRPDRALAFARTLLRWGPSPGAASIGLAARFPDEPQIIDEIGTLTFREVNERTNRLADALRARGLGPGSQIAIMCRNHRGFIETVLAASKLGADSLFLNTMFAGPQLADVIKREGPDAVVYDEEFAEIVRPAARRRKRFVAWQDSLRPADPTLEELIDEGSPRNPDPPGRTPRVTILTSGTTGTPKGARRSTPDSIDPAVSFLSKIPLQARQRTHIASPLFHSWGLAHFQIGLLIGSTYVLRRRFQPEECLAVVAQHRCYSLAAVPVMLKRILELPEEVRRRYDLSCLKVVALSGSALPGDLALRWMDEFGDNLYNLYGSTEVAWATIATPAELRAAPGTAGTPPRGTIVRLYDEEGRPVPAGRTGRIFVGNRMLFEGYTDGNSKEVIDGLMATGDVGRFDSAGRLFVEGRDDEMIVSGGENVFPQEVEDTLAVHPAVREAACIGVDDEEWGQRLVAFVALEAGSTASEDELKDWVRSNLARYKVPREVIFLDELPRNATGKVLKRVLRERYEQSAQPATGRAVASS